MLRNKVLDSLKLIVFLLAFYTFAQLYYTRNFSFKEDFELIIGDASNISDLGGFARKKCTTQVLGFS